MKNNLCLDAAKSDLEAKDFLNALKETLAGFEILAVGARLSETWTNDICLLHEQERQALGGMVNKRVREFVAGRVLARRALAELGLDDHAIPKRQDRSPGWPVGVVGSITHTNDLCVVAVAKEDHVTALGIDVERSRALEGSLWPQIGDEDEIRKLPSGMQTGVAVCWLFSAKEAFYKAQYPLTGKFLGFEDVRVTLDIANGLFAVDLRSGDEAVAALATSGVGYLWQSNSHLGAAWIVPCG